jgi:hypothetical protein
MEGRRVFARSQRPPPSVALGESSRVTDTLLDYAEPAHTLSSPPSCLSLPLPPPCAPASAIASLIVPPSHRSAPRRYPFSISSLSSESFIPTHKRKQILLIRPAPLLPPLDMSLSPSPLPLHPLVRASPARFPATAPSTPSVVPLSIAFAVLTHRPPPADSSVYPGVWT